MISEGSLKTVVVAAEGSAFSFFAENIKKNLTDLKFWCRSCVVMCFVVTTRLVSLKSESSLIFMWNHFYRFTLTAQSLFQIKRQLDKLGELILKVTYESDPIPLQRPQMEEQVKYLIYHLIKR